MVGVRRFVFNFAEGDVNVSSTKTTRLVGACFVCLFFYNKMNESKITNELISQSVMFGRDPSTEQGRL